MPPSGHLWLSQYVGPPVTEFVIRLARREKPNPKTKTRKPFPVQKNVDDVHYESRAGQFKKPVFIGLDCRKVLTRPRIRC